MNDLTRTATDREELGALSRHASGRARRKLLVFERLEPRSLLASDAANLPPTVNPIDAILVSRNATQYVVELTGISPGGHEAQRFAVAAVSSNPDLIPTLSVNSSDERFVVGPHYSAGVRSQGTETGDFNGDAILDVAVLNKTDGNVSVFYGNGDGTLQQTASWDVNGDPWSLLVVDVNEDGLDDIVVTNSESGGVAIRTSSGNSFSEAKTYSTGCRAGFADCAGAAPLQSGDFDNDGNLDLVVGNLLYHVISVLRGDGKGEFSAPIVSDVDPTNGLPKSERIGPVGLTVADFNLDGNLDVGVSLQGYADIDRNIPGDLRIMLGDGMGKLTLSQQFEVDGYCDGIVSDDFNEDGFIDLAVASRVTGAVTVFFGNVHGEFSSLTTLKALDPSSLATPPIFTGLGDLPGGNFKSEAFAISADGNVVVGRSSTYDGTEPFRWTLNGGMSGLGHLAGGNHMDVAYAVSADGSVIVGYGGSPAFRWTEAAGMTPTFGTQAYAVSADGQAIAGYVSVVGDTLAFGPAGIIGRGTSYGISGDGTIVVGTVPVAGSEPDAFRWTEATGMVSLGNTSVAANAISRDGSTIVGVRNADGWYNAFRWTAATGMVDVPGIPDSWYTEAYAVSSDGGVVVGRSAQ